MGAWGAPQGSSERGRFENQKRPGAHWGRGSYGPGSGHPERQQGFQRQKKKKGQLSFTKESPKHAAREESQESWEPRDTRGVRARGSDCQVRTGEPRQGKPRVGGEGGGRGMCSRNAKHHLIF